MKKSLIAALIIFTFVFNNTNSQVTRLWEATYNGPANYEDYPNDVAVDANGNVFTTGRSKGENTGITDIATIKYSPAGVLQWVARYNGPGNGTDMPYGMAIDLNNNIYIAGVTEGGPLLIKYDNNGNLIYANIFAGGGWFTSIKKDNTGNIYVCGHNNDSLLLVKYYSSGQHAWTVHFRHPGSSQSMGLALTIDVSGNIYVCGRAVGDALVAKFNANGIYHWSSTYNSIFNSYDGFVDLTVLNDGSIVCGGNLADSNSFNRGLVIKYNSQGILQWTIIDQTMSIYFVRSDELGSIYIGANYYPGTGQHGAGIIKYNKFGVRQWVRYHLPHQGFNEIIWDMEIKNCFSLYINYMSFHVDSSTYFGISKYNSNAALKWEYSEQGQVYINDTTYATGTTCLALDDNRNIYTARTGVSAPKYNDFHTIKYSETFYTVSGQVTYRDNNQPVESGYVKALYYDESTASIVTVDSTIILPGGYYTLSKVPQDSLDIMFYQDDDLLLFVPTYYVSTLDWREATKIYASQNLTNINGQVFRINNQTNPFNITGYCVQNINFNQTGSLQDAIIYAKTGNEFKNYGISDVNGLYSVTKLPAGVYTILAHRFGFAPVIQNLTITNSSMQSINFNFGNPIGIKQISGIIPDKYSLSQNYPNPFNPSTTIKFSIPRAGHVNITVFDVLGREIDKIVNEFLNAGTYSVKWDASNLPSGIYFYRLESGGFITTKKMILLK